MPQSPITIKIDPEPFLASIVAALLEDIAGFEVPVELDVDTELSADPLCEMPEVVPLRSIGIGP